MTLYALRKKINAVDAQILKLLAKRFRFSKMVGNIKKQSNRAITDTAREKELARLHASLEKKYDLSPICMKAFWDIIFKESKHVQKKS